MVSSRHYFIEPLLRSKGRNSRNGGLFTRFIRVDVVVISSERSEHLIPQRLRFICGFSVLIDLRKKKLRQDQRRRNKESCLSVCLNDTSLCLKRLFDLQTLIDDQIDRIDRVDWCRIRRGQMSAYSSVLVTNQLVSVTNHSNQLSSWMVHLWWNKRISSGGMHTVHFCNAETQFFFDSWLCPVDYPRPHLFVKPGPDLGLKSISFELTCELVANNLTNKWLFLFQIFSAFACWFASWWWRLNHVLESR